MNKRFFFKASIERGCDLVRTLALPALALILALGAAPAAHAFTDGAPTVLITGSNRGIGLELARQYAEKGWNVIATARKPDKAEELQAIAAEHPDVVVEKLDVTDHDAIDALAAKYKDQPIDVLLNNAGITGSRESQVFGQMDYDVFFKVINVNVVGPLKMAEAFIDNVAASDQKKIVSITSSEGSITMVRGARNYFYRPSKAALNMVMRTLSKEVARRGVIVGLINPGLVATDMTSMLPDRIKMSPQESVSGIIAVIDGLTPETSGTFLQWDGKELPW